MSFWFDLALAVVYGLFVWYWRMHWNKCAWKLQLDSPWTAIWFDNSISSAGPAGYTPQYCLGRVTTGTHHMVCWFSTLLTIALFSHFNNPWADFTNHSSTCPGRDYFEMRPRSQLLSRRLASFINWILRTKSSSSFIFMADRIGWGSLLLTILAYDHLLYAMADSMFLSQSPIIIIIIQMLQSRACMAFTVRNVDVNRTWHN